MRRFVLFCLGVGPYPVFYACHLCDRSLQALACVVIAAHHFDENRLIALNKYRLPTAIGMAAEQSSCQRLVNDIEPF